MNRRISLFLCTLLCLANVCLAAPRRSKNAGALTTYTTQIIPLIIVGDGWSQRIVLQNVDDWSTTARMRVFDKDGAAFPIEIRNLGRNSTFTLQIQPGQTLLLDLPINTGPQRLGWAVLYQYTTGPSGDYSGIGDTFGQIIFRKSTPGLPDFMCSLVMGSYSYDKLTAFFDNTGGNFTGMGILTSSVPSGSTNNPVSLKVTVRALDGRVVAEKTIQQKLGVLYWMNMGVDFPETAGRTGTFEVTPVSSFSTALTGVSLQFSGSAFTVVTPFEF